MIAPHVVGMDDLGGELTKRQEPTMAQLHNREGGPDSVTPVVAFSTKKDIKGDQQGYVNGVNKVLK